MRMRRASNSIGRTNTLTPKSGSCSDHHDDSGLVTAAVGAATGAMDVKNVVVLEGE
jgi:hypothetical protein